MNRQRPQTASYQKPTTSTMKDNSVDNYYKKPATLGNILNGGPYKNANIFH